jgi:Trypsin-co-occurring domain 1
LFQVVPQEEIMKRLVEFPLEDGTTMLVEIEEAEQEGLERISRGDVIERAQQTLEKSLEKVRPAAQFILDKLRGLHDSPNEIEVQFGLKLNAESGVVLAAASMEANYTIILRWAKQDP